MMMMMMMWQTWKCGHNRKYETQIKNPFMDKMFQNQSGPFYPITLGWEWQGGQIHLHGRGRLDQIVGTTDDVLSPLLMLICDNQY